MKFVGSVGVVLTSIRSNLYPRKLGAMNDNATVWVGIEFEPEKTLAWSQRRARATVDHCGGTHVGAKNGLKRARETRTIRRKHQEVVVNE